MSVNRRVSLQASVAAATGAPSATIARKRLVNVETSGLLIVADLTNIGASGTIRPNLYMAGPGDANFILIWQGAVSDSSAAKVNAWEIYPQGIEGVGTTLLRDRASLALPEELWIDWTVATAGVTFSAEAWWLV